MDIEPPDFTPPRRGESPLNINSGISIGLALMLLSGYVWMNAQFTAMGQKFSDVELRRVQDTAERDKSTAELKVAIADARRETSDARREAKDSSSDRWSKKNMSHWAVKLQRTNSDAGVKLLVPDPDDERASE